MNHSTIYWKGKEKQTKKKGAISVIPFHSEGNLYMNIKVSERIQLIYSVNDRNVGFFFVPVYIS